MGTPLSPAKVVLLAVHFAVHGDIDNLSILAAQHPSTIRKDILLRILLTHIPETVHPSQYVPLLKRLDEDRFDDVPRSEVDTIPVQGLSEEQASKRARKLHLSQLSDAGIPKYGRRVHDDLLTLFLFQRAYKIDEEAGMLAHVPSLLLPFLHIEAIRTWTVSTVLPLLRRSQQYYAQTTAPLSLQEFQKLSDQAAVEYLLSGVVEAEDGQTSIVRDLRGLIAPWLHNEARWEATKSSNSGDSVKFCFGWEQVLEWLTAQASTDWPVAVSAFEQWDGPSQDADLCEGISPWFQDAEQTYLDRGYARAALAGAYSISDSTAEAIDGAYRVMSKIRALLDHDSEGSLDDAMRILPGLADLDMAKFQGSRAAWHMRNDLLSSSNPLTTPEPQATGLLKGLVVSAGLMQRLGGLDTIRRAGDLLFLQDHGEQKAEAAKLIRTVSNKAPRGDEQYWDRARREILWLHSWGAGDAESGKGILGLVPLDYIQSEFLKALLAKSHYDLARTYYQDSVPSPLSDKAVQDAVQSSALHAFDNASNPNRTRGGLKKCDEIIHAFPKSVSRSLPMVKRIEALLKATHALSEYRLVLKQGEPFNPVVLRVHSDPIAIIERVLEQNHDAYTRLNEFLEMGLNLVNAGLSVRMATRSRPSLLGSQDSDVDIAIAEKRIVAMCIEAALRQDDFETAYSYVVSRLGSCPSPSSISPSQAEDIWSWSAALKAGQYIRTSRSQAPTHLGTSSGNLEIRHLEQRIECLSTALRVAPPSQLQEILKTFRRCEEQLDSAIKEEAEKEAAWDAAGDTSDIPGSFDTPDPDRAYPPRNITASATARQAEEAPMSLFDLSRATARVAQKNFTSLSNLHGAAQGFAQSHSAAQGPDQDGNEREPRTRKRDQLREAATGTLVSGVGWLIGANVNQNRDDGR